MNIDSLIISVSNDVNELPEPIKRHIEEITSSEYTHRDGEVHVTELLYCLRKAYYRRMAEKNGENVEKELKNRWWLYRGVVFDELWTGLFPKNQVRITHRIPDGPVIAGKIDFIYNDTVYDLKTISNEYAVRDGPKEEHVKQVLFYAWVNNTPKAGLIYVWLGGVKIFLIDTSRAYEVVKELEERAMKLWTALRKMEPPEREESWQCKYCEFKDICLRGGIE